MTIPPVEGDEFTLDDRPVRVIAVNADSATFCVMYLDNLDAYGHGDRRHDIPWPEIVGQQWACDYTEEEP